MASLNFSFTVPDGMVPAILEKFSDHHGYQELIPSNPDDPSGDQIPNPQTRAAFSKQKVASFIKESVKARRSEDAAIAARLSEIAAVDAEVVIE